MTKMQESLWTTARHADGGVRGLPCILVIREAALAADLITGLVFKHLDQNLAKQPARKAHFSEFGRTSGEIINFHHEQLPVGC